MTKFRLEPHLLQSLNLFCIGDNTFIFKVGNLPSSLKLQEFCKGVVSMNLSSVYEEEKEQDVVI